MAIGFRKSLFGFNSDDVMDYIEKTHSEFADKEKALNDKIDSLDGSLNDANAKINKILSEKAEMEKRLKEYDEKCEEMERLSQNIGKLYLVAEANADSVIKSAKENADVSKAEVEKNISSVQSAHDALSKLNVEIIETATRFSDKLQSLMVSLNKTKDDLSFNSSAVKEKLNEYEALLSELHIENK